MRLIDADAFKQRNEKLLKCDFPYISEETLEELIDDAPTIEERKKGKWLLSDEQRQEDVDNGNYRFICSECGKSDIHSKAVTVSFCWNCGADMREEDNDEVH